MNMNRYIVLAIAFVAALASCTPELDVEFGIDRDRLEIGADGGSRDLKVSASGEWSATANVPWITVSPAYGTGTGTCRIIVDSSVVFTSAAAVRQGVVRIEESGSEVQREITVTQDNYRNSISIDEPDVEIPNFDDWGKRWFDVCVKTNTDFKLKITYNEDIGNGITRDWLEIDEYQLELDRGARPRKVRLHCEWGINSVPFDRIAKVEFIPVDADGNEIDASGFERHDALEVVQSAAQKVEIGRSGDSLAIVSITRTINVMFDFDAAEKMDNWDNVTLWETNDERNGRVRSVSFYMFNTKESIPYEIQYLTEAEEISFYSNANAFIKELSVGPYITKLDKLKRLTIGAYGLVGLSEDFANLKNLEYLNLAGNNFKEVPSILTPENFPNLRALMIGANQSRVAYDLSNVNVSSDMFSSRYAGLFDENLRADNLGSDRDKRGLPLRLLRWNLDTLSLSVNYLMGTLPSDRELLANGFESYTDADYVGAGADTLWTGLKEQNIPKLLTKTKKFDINLNRFTGELPKWILYHPNLDLWIPDIFVFNQEGKDWNGKSAGFTNTPENLDYYYGLPGYENKYYSPKKKKE